jgi:hypothetical protein
MAVGAAIAQGNNITQTFTHVVNTTPGKLEPQLKYSEKPNPVDIFNKISQRHISDQRPTYAARVTPSENE